MYTIIGCVKFVNKSGNEMYHIYVIYEDNRLDIGKMACMDFVCFPNSVQGTIKDGAKCNVFYNKSGFVNNVQITS